MTRYFRSNPYLGTWYEVTQKQALRKINNRWWTPVWDDYYERFSDNSWYNIKDPERDWLFKVEDEDGSCSKL